MKKLILLILIIALCLSSNMAYASTYKSILNENGFFEIPDAYINKNELKSMLGIIFKADISYNLEGVDHATGYDFFSVISELGFLDYMILNKEAYYNRALTYHSFSELLDYYFYIISKIHNIKSVEGVLSKSSSGYLLTYEDGKTLEFSEFNYFNPKEKYNRVQVIIKDDKIIDVCPAEEGVPLSLLVDKKEVEGKLFLLYDSAIIINSKNSLYEYPITKDFKLLNKKTDNIVLIIGSYKKSTNLAAVAVGKDD